MNAEEILAEVARATWYDTHGGADCPAYGIPTMAEHAEWLNKNYTTRAVSTVYGPAFVWDAHQSKLIDASGMCGFVPLGPDRAKTHTVAIVPSDCGDRLTVTVGIADVHSDWLSMPEATRPRHPLAPLLTAWQARTRPGTPFRPRKRASVPRLHRVPDDEAMQLFKTEPPQGQIALTFGRDFEVVDSCVSWLLEMYAQAGSSKVGDKRSLAWSFRIVIGALVNLAQADRDGHSRDLTFTVDEIVDWLELAKGGRWPNRARDYPRLADALDELQSYRVTVGKLRFWLASAYGIPAVYEKDAPCVLTVRTPPSAATGMSIDWPRFRVEAAASALRGRGYLSLMALLDRSARRGHPITRLIPAPALDVDGKPQRRKGGAIVRTGELIPNPAANFAPLLPERDIARFLGMGDSRMARHRARRTITDFAKGPNAIIDLEPVPKGWRVFGSQTNPE